MNNEDENSDSEELMCVSVHDIIVKNTDLLVDSRQASVSALPNWTSLFSHFKWELDTQLEESPPSDIS